MDELFVEVTIEGEVLTDLLESVLVEESDTQTDMAMLTFGNSDLVLSDILHEGLTTLKRYSNRHGNADLWE